MEYVRSFQPESLDKDKFGFQVLADTESAVVTGCRVPEGASGFQRHIHDADQVYFVLQGIMEGEIDGRKFRAEAGSVVFVPEGAPHSNRYPGPGPEMHLDVIVPATSRYSQLSVPVGADAAGGPGTGFARPRTSDEIPEVVAGFRSMPLADAATSCHSMSFRLNEIDPGGDKLPWHIHDFDQYYFILEGEMQLEVGRKSYVATPYDLVYLPSGVPHRNWNISSATERHLAMLVPEPDKSEQADYLVEFHLTGEHF